MLGDGGVDCIGGWIVLNDGRQRGAITLGGEVVDDQALDPTIGQADGLAGTFGTNCFINPHTGERICRYLNRGLAVRRRSASEW